MYGTRWSGTSSLGDNPHVACNQIVRYNKAMNIQKAQEALGLMGRVRTITYKAGTDQVLRVSEWSDNKIMNGTNTGLNLVLNRLNSDNTYSLNINYADIGTGTNTPAISDTTLQTAVSRTPKANGTVTGSVLSLFFFWADANLANGTYREFGAFVDGTATISTGQIFERALFAVAYTKATGEDTTVQLDITGAVS